MPTTLVRPERTTPRRLTLHTVTSGDRVILETVCADDAERRRKAWDKVWEDIAPPAVITTAEFVAVQGGAE